MHQKLEKSHWEFGKAAEKQESLMSSGRIHSKVHEVLCGLFEEIENVGIDAWEVSERDEWDEVAVFRRDGQSECWTLAAHWNVCEFHKECESRFGKREERTGERRRKTEETGRGTTEEAGEAESPEGKERHEWCVSFKNTFLLVSHSIEKNMGNPIVHLGVEI